MDEVGDADSVTIAITTGDDYLEIRIRKLNAAGHGNSAPVQRVDAVSVHIPGQVRGAADAGNNDHVFRRDSGFGGAHLDALQDAEVTTARTPIRIDYALKTLYWKLYNGCHRSP